MTEDGQPIGDDDLLAFVDGRLDEARRDSMEQALRESPDLQARVAADRAAGESLRQRLNPIAALPLPARLTIDAILRRRRETLRRRIMLAAACVALLLGGAAVGWEAHDVILAGSFRTGGAGVAMTAADAISAHRVFVVEVAHPVEVGASQEAHLVQWLSRRVGQKLIVPDLGAQGYVLMGGRILPAGTEAAAQFMYRNAADQRVTVYIRASADGDTRFSFVRADGYAAFSWVEEGLGFAIVGPVDRTQLLEIASAVYQQADPQHRAAPAPM